MRSSPPLLLVAASLALSSSALAETATSDAAPDARSGLVGFALRAGYQAPLGSAESRASQPSLASWGPSFGADVHYGLSRYVLAGAFGDYSSFGAPDGCARCSGNTLAFGLGVEYHLIEGTPFDPFIGFGLGWRMSRFERGGDEVSYGGPLARITVASDWYPTPAFGFGPYLDFSMGRYISRDPGSIQGGAANSFFTAGLRIALEPFR